MSHAVQSVCVQAVPVPNGAKAELIRTGIDAVPLERQTFKTKPKDLLQKRAVFR
jgi:hypothetical protein